MSSFARRIQKNILEAKNHSAVPLLHIIKLQRDNPGDQYYAKMDTTRPPFSLNQIAFIGGFRVTKDNIEEAVQLYPAYKEAVYALAAD